MSLTTHLLFDSIIMSVDKINKKELDSTKHIPRLPSHPKETII